MTSTTRTRTDRNGGRYGVGRRLLADAFPVGSARSVSGYVERARERHGRDEKRARGDRPPDPRAAENAASRRTSPRTQAPTAGPTVPGTGSAYAARSGRPTHQAATPSPIEDEDNNIFEMCCWTNPDGFYDELREEYAHFPLHNYWARHERGEHPIDSLGRPRGGRLVRFQTPVGVRSAPRLRRSARQSGFRYLPRRARDRRRPARGVLVPPIR